MNNTKLTSFSFSFEYRDDKSSKRLWVVENFIITVENGFRLRGFFGDMRFTCYRSKTVLLKCFSSLYSCSLEPSTINKFPFEDLKRLVFVWRSVIRGQNKFKINDVFYEIKKVFLYTVMISSNLMCRKF